jgi:hypothetical protein
VLEKNLCRGRVHLAKRVGNQFAALGKVPIGATTAIMLKLDVAYWPLAEVGQLDGNGTQLWVPSLLRFATAALTLSRTCRKLNEAAGPSVLSPGFNEVKARRAD